MVPVRVPTHFLHACRFRTPKHHQLMKHRKLSTWPPDSTPPPHAAPLGQPQEAEEAEAKAQLLGTSQQPELVRDTHASFVMVALKRASQCMLGPKSLCCLARSGARAVYQSPGADRLQPCHPAPPRGGVSLRAAPTHIAVKLWSSIDRKR
jgi:hypothetical protein